MEQKQFTDYVIPRIIDRFPQLRNYVQFRPSDIVNIDYPSRQGELTLRISTQDEEITIGFAVGSKFGWHTHMNVFGATTPEEETGEAIKLLDNILANRETIAHSTVLGYFITDDIESVEQYKLENELIEIFYWNDL